MQSHCLPIGTEGHEPTLVNEITCQTLWGYFFLNSDQGYKDFNCIFLCLKMQF